MFVCETCVLVGDHCEENSPWVGLGMEHGGQSVARDGARRLRDGCANSLSGFVGGMFWMGPEVRDQFSAQYGQCATWFLKDLGPPFIKWSARRCATVARRFRESHGKTNGF